MRPTRALLFAWLAAGGLLAAAAAALAPVAAGDDDDAPSGAGAGADGARAGDLAIWVPEGMDEALLRRELEDDLGADLAGAIPVVVLEALAVLQPETFGPTLEDGYRRYGWLYLEERPELPVGIIGRRVMGVRVHNFNCLACHSGHERMADGSGVLVVGATNRTIDFAGWYADIVLTVRALLDAEIEAAIAAKAGGEDDEVARGRGIRKTIERIAAAAREGLARRGETVEMADTVVLATFVNGLASGPRPERPPENERHGPGRTIVTGAYRSLRFEVEPGPFAPVKAPDLFGVPYRESLLWAGVETHPEDRPPAERIANNGMLVPWIQLEPFTRRPPADERIIARREAFLRMGKLFAASQAPPAPAPATEEERALFAKGQKVYEATCTECHGSYRHAEAVRPDGSPGLRTEVVEYEETLLPLEEVGTDPVYARTLDALFVEKFMETKIATEGYLALRETQSYVARPHLGLRLRAPYLHNGSVPSLEAMLTPPADRPKKIEVGHRGVERDVTVPGNRPMGHAYGTELPEAEKRALVEYLKRL